MLLMSRVNLGPAMLRYVDATLGTLRKAGFPIELADSPGTPWTATSTAARSRSSTTLRAAAVPRGGGDLPAAAALRPPPAADRADRPRHGGPLRRRARVHLRARPHPRRPGAPPGRSL